MGKSFVEIFPTLKSRTAIAMGKAFRSNVPIIFEVPQIIEVQKVTSELVSSEPLEEDDTLFFKEFIEVLYKSKSIQDASFL